MRCISLSGVQHMTLKVYSECHPWNNSSIFQILFSLPCQQSPARRNLLGIIAGCWGCCCVCCCMKGDGFRFWYIACLIMISALAFSNVATLSYTSCIPLLQLRLRKRTFRISGKLSQGSLQQKETMVSITRAWNRTAFKPTQSFNWLIIW